MYPVTYGIAMEFEQLSSRRPEGLGFVAPLHEPMQDRLP